MAMNYTSEGPIGGCCFMCTLNAVTNLTVDEETYIAGTEVFDVGGDLDVSAATGTSFGTHGARFTAPVTGKYQLNFWLELTSIPSNFSYWRMNMKTSNRVMYTIHGDGRDHNYETLSASWVSDMDASDVASCMIYQNGGSAQADTFGAQSCFSGHLCG